LEAVTQARQGSLVRAATAPAGATRLAVLPTADMDRAAMWEAAAPLAPHLEVTVQLQAAALPTADLGSPVTWGTTPAAPVEASTTLAAAASNTILMEATASRFRWEAFSKAGRRRRAASTSHES